MRLSDQERVARHTEERSRLAVCSRVRCDDRVAKGIAACPDRRRCSEALQLAVGGAPPAVCPEVILAIAVADDCRKCPSASHRVHVAVHLKRHTVDSADQPVGAGATCHTSAVLCGAVGAAAVAKGRLGARFHAECFLAEEPVQAWPAKARDQYAGRVAVVPVQAGTDGRVWALIRRRIVRADVDPDSVSSINGVASIMPCTALANISIPSITTMSIHPATNSR